MILHVQNECGSFRQMQFRSHATVHDNYLHKLGAFSVHVSCNDPNIYVTYECRNISNKPKFDVYRFP
jgi:hypothetical protein